MCANIECYREYIYALKLNMIIVVDCANAIRWSMMTHNHLSMLLLDVVAANDAELTMINDAKSGISNQQ